MLKRQKNSVSPMTIYFQCGMRLAEDIRCGQQWGLSIALLVGIDAYKSMLKGAHAMDEHFLKAPTNENIPVLMALVDIWNQHFLGVTAHAIFPYDTRLSYLPAYLQQLFMESNGKSVDREGNALTTPSSPVIFGDVGTNSQHSFFQLLHQGTPSVSCDFIGVARPVHNNQIQHDMLPSKYDWANTSIDARPNLGRCIRRSR